MDFFRETKYHLGQLTHNIIRIVLGIAELNKCLNLTLGIKKIKYYYSIGRMEDKWNLKARPSSPSLIEGLASSHKGMYSDIIVIIGNVELDPQIS